MSLALKQFHVCDPTPWRGRYARVMGDRGVFHLQYHDGALWPCLIWETEEGRATCRAIRCPAAIDLAGAVAKAKRHAGGEGGGAFVINEFGRVLVPASNGDGRYFLAGRLSGKLLFENPFVPEEPIDLSDHARLENGDPWKLPYVGMPYHLHRNGHIYFYQQDDAGARSVCPPQQDQELIRAIRNLRPYGAVRLLVNHAGLVLTKVPLDTRRLSEDDWQPVFVGSIRPSLWFQEE